MAVCSRSVNGKLRSKDGDLLRGFCSKRTDHWSIFRRVTIVLAMLSIGLLAIVPRPTVAQPPLPDPMFRNGFELPNQAPVADAGSN